jgi:uncharacterized protein YyaL (SSP411 family)
MMHQGEVYDHEWNGFFRYATRRDWSEPHYEKMLEDEAGLLRNALALYRTAGSGEHRPIAEGIVEYVEWKLRDKERGYFYGSQDADEEFYKLTAEQRAEHEEPYIDRTAYTSWNAQMVSAYLEASWTLDRPDLRDAALQGLDFLWTELRDGETGSMHRYFDGAPHIVGLLGDQSQTARALLDAAEVTGDSLYLERAIVLAELLASRFQDDENGGFWDTWDAGEEVGRLKDRQKSVQENAIVAEVFVRLGHLTREQGYAEIGRRTLEAFVGVYQQMGYFASGYAKWADIALHPPVEVNIVGDRDAAEEIQHAALWLNVPHRIVQVLDPARDAERLAALSLPSEPAPAAYVCVGTACSAPVSSPEQVMQTVREMQTIGPRELVLGD